MVPSCRGVDEAREIRRVDLDVGRRRVGRRGQQGFPILGLDADVDPVGRPDHDDRAEVRETLATGRIGTHLGHPSGQARLGDDDPGPAVGENVAQELALVGRVDGDLDRTELERGKEADDLLRRVLQQGGDPIAPTDSEPGQTVRSPVCRPVHLPRRERDTVKIQVGTVRIRREPARERVENGRLTGSAHDFRSRPCGPGRSGPAPLVRP